MDSEKDTAPYIKLYIEYQSQNDKTSKDLTLSVFIDTISHNILLTKKGKFGK